MANLCGMLCRACLGLTTHIDLTSITDPGSHQSDLLFANIRYWSVSENFGHSGGILSSNGLQGL